MFIKLILKYMNVSIIKNAEIKNIKYKIQKLYYIIHFI